MSHGNSTLGATLLTVRTEFGEILSSSLLFFSQAVHICENSFMNVNCADSQSKYSEVKCLKIIGVT